MKMMVSRRMTPCHNAWTHSQPLKTNAAAPGGRRSGTTWDDSWLRVGRECL